MVANMINASDVEYAKQARVPHLFEMFARALMKERPENPVRFCRELLERHIAETAPTEVEVPETEPDTARPTDVDGAPIVGTSQHCYVIRHGHRIDDFDKEWTSDTPYDPPLTDEGKEAALEVGKEFLELPLETRPTLIISSPFTRCLETAAGIAKGLGKTKIRVHKQLGEIQDPKVLKHDGPPVLPVYETLDGVDVEALECDSVPYPEERYAAMQRYTKAFATVPDLHHDNVILVSHGEGVGQSVASLHPAVTVYSTPYCSYSVRHRSREGGFGEWQLKGMHETNGKVEWMQLD